MFAMEAIVPELRIARSKNIVVKADVIVAWGSTDIDDLASELHRRYEISVHSYGSYHSIDSGKLAMAPYLTKVCADRILLEFMP